MYTPKIGGECSEAPVVKKPANAEKVVTAVEHLISRNTVPSGHPKANTRPGVRGSVTSRVRTGAEEFA